MEYTNTDLNSPNRMVILNIFKGIKGSAMWTFFMHDDPVDFFSKAYESILCGKRLTPKQYWCGKTLESGKENIHLLNQQDQENGTEQLAN